MIVAQSKLLTLEKFGSGMHYVMVDAATANKFLKNGNKRVLCTLNGEQEFHAALMPKKEGGHYINIGSAICKKLKIKLGSTVRVSLRADETPYQFDMPEEFEEVLASDPAAGKVFRELSEGNQRGLIYLVTQVKSPDKRIERAFKIASKLKAGITSPRLVLK